MTRDFQKKRDTLKALKKKAESRNPDEFYFNMVSTQKVVRTNVAKSYGTLSLSVGAYVLIFAVQSKCYGRMRWKEITVKS